MTGSLPTRTKLRDAARWARVLLAAYLVVLAWLVFEPGELGQGHPLLVAAAVFVAGLGVAYDLAFGVVEFCANIVLFVPLGVLLPVAARDLLLRPDEGLSRYALLGCAVAGLSLSLSIECAQLYIAGRVSDPRDLLANTAGAVIGAVIVTTLLRRSRPRR